MTESEYTFNLTDVDHIEVKSVFNRLGILHIRSAISEDIIEYFNRTTSEALKSVLKLHGIAVPSAENDIDKLYNRLFHTPGITDFWKFIIKTLAKNGLLSHRLICEPSIIKIVQELIGHDHFQLNWDQNIFRVDRPNEDFAAFEWHQDHPYILLSESAISVWITLTDVTPEMGPLKFVPMSHQEQFHPVVIRNKSMGNCDSYRNKSSKHRYIELKEGNDLDHVFEQKAVQLPMKAGDALFFHSHLVHRSGANVSDRSRWVFVARYGDMLDQEMVARGWTTTQGASPELLKNLYPHRVIVSKEQK